MAKNVIAFMRDVFIDEITRNGFQLDKSFPHAEIYRVTGKSKGLICLHISREKIGKGFWGLRKDFVDCLVREKWKGISIEEKNQLVKSLEEEKSFGSIQSDVSSEFVKSLPLIMRRIILSLYDGEFWVIVLIQDDREKILWDGWVLSGIEELDGLSKKWSVVTSNDGREDYKINENSLPENLMLKGYKNIINTTMNLLGNKAEAL